jgi:hypothetical protein
MRRVETLTAALAARIGQTPTAADSASPAARRRRMAAGAIAIIRSQDIESREVDR